MPVKSEVAMLLALALEQNFESEEVIGVLVSEIPDSYEEGTIQASIEGVTHKWLWCLGENPTPRFLSIAEEKLRPSNLKEGEGFPIDFKSFRLTNREVLDAEIDVCVVLIEHREILPIQ